MIWYRKQALSMKMGSVPQGPFRRTPHEQDLNLAPLQQQDIIGSTAGVVPKTLAALPRALRDCETVYELFLTNFCQSLERNGM
ncbi:hypothetical protein MSG28_001230 [Choristoneura fumiferana]|uniref:Uncharacterized protein n=1 Tax=Choristoneura fumiferana TaxID=7141 RepID=A0ACC0K4K0_CHOFU|nr:hypothetical protein MSG28_001230 [Choristoneura fumiferana]